MLRVCDVDRIVWHELTMRHVAVDRHIQGCRRPSETTHLTGGSRAADRHDTIDNATLLRRSYTRAVVGYVSYGDGRL
jgi:hypothetical protein